MADGKNERETLTPEDVAAVAADLTVSLYILDIGGHLESELAKSMGSQVVRLAEAAGISQDSLRAASHEAMGYLLAVHSGRNN